MENALQIATLQELETRIKAGLETFVDVGLCLLEIRDRRLYREKGYTRFEDYCREQWGWGKQYAYRQIEAAKTIEIIGRKSPMGDEMPKTERQARELAPLVKADEQEAVKTWQKLREEHGDNLTAEKIRQAVKERLQPEAPQEQPSSTMEEADEETSGIECAQQEEKIILPGKRHDEALRMSESNEWYTPSVYLEAAREVLGWLDIDPASCEAANKNVRAKVYYDKDSNGLQRDWPGKVWLNPPYGGLSAVFTARLIEQYQTGITTEAILLVNANSTDTKWFQPLWEYILCFTDHRINFICPDGEKSGSTHGSVFIYFGPNQKKFANAFSRFGVIVRRWEYDNTE
ncbi:MAG: DNA N-6-adenine-methyltransferase [Candidatus Thermoplasmatota archaeon]|nr:DNA N-6-adenine-methyltransferase [Candidatus Thermoplasmatota archaeon]